MHELDASSDPSAATILYDAGCGLCQRSIEFVRRRDRAARFTYLPLDSDAGQDLFRRVSRADFPRETLILIEDGRVWTRSTAVLRICRRLPGAWRLVYLLVLAPRRWRDRAYDLLARNRHRWFRTWCPLPAATHSHPKETMACAQRSASPPKTLTPP